jgi:hypothetical protein
MLHCWCKTGWESLYVLFELRGQHADLKAARFSSVNMSCSSAAGPDGGRASESHSLTWVRRRVRSPVVTFKGLSNS